MKRRAAICLCLTFVLALLCAQASAVSFWSYGTSINFLDEQFAVTGAVYGPNEAWTANLWVGTVEAPGLGKAFLFSESPANGGLSLQGSEGYKSYTGRLTIQPSPACTLPAGTWSVLFQNGVPYLNKDGMYEPKMIGVEVFETTFSIPVRDQYGNPVAGAEFALDGITWGGNGELDTETIVSDENGILTFPYSVIADRSYWFKQTSAPAGYEKMEEELIEVEISTSGSFRAMTNTSYPNETYVDVIINKSTSAAPSTGQTPSGGGSGNGQTPPVSGNGNGSGQTPAGSGTGSGQTPSGSGNGASGNASTPPRTGDAAQPALLLGLLLLSALGIAGLARGLRASKRS